MPTLIPTILCGGAGSRLWPASREQHPKPFIRLADGQSLIQKAFLRASRQSNVSEILTVTNSELLFKTEEDYQEVNADHIPLSFILEPFGRNTAAAIAAAALHIAESHGENAILLVLAADHLIEAELEFRAAVNQAVALAEQGKLVTFGIQPDAPETGYGYIQAEGDTVLRFVEKPDRQTAEAYIQTGQYFWNSGMFCFEAGVMLQQMREHCPDILDAVLLSLQAAKQDSAKPFKQIALDPERFANVREDSIDYAVFEKTKVAAMVPCDIGWSDIGSWAALSMLTPPNDLGNRIYGDVQLHDVQNCFIHSPDRLVGAVGIKDLIIVDTPDALLIADKSRTQEVKHVYTQLKNTDHQAHKLHRTVARPWGTYTVLEEGENFKIKRITVKPKSSLSLQMHHHRSEHWVVIHGEANIVNGDKTLTIKHNESTFIPAGNKHRLANQTDDELVIIEVQTGSYVGEDDIVRFEDVYGRC